MDLDDFWTEKSLRLYCLQKSLVGMALFLGFLPLTIGRYLDNPVNQVLGPWRLNAGSKEGDLGVGDLAGVDIWRP